MKPRRIGILFYFHQDEDVWVLLGERRYPLIWDLPDDENPEVEKDPWQIATGISRVILGGMPGAFEKRFSITFPLGLPGPLRTTFVVELPGRPESPDFETARLIALLENSLAFRRFAWRPLHQLPEKIHGALVPVLWHLWLTQTRGKAPRRSTRRNGDPFRHR